ncbi:MAG TPA: hypothetical protein VGV61_17530 [Thermoanaerobaculia bacterium]|jgi:hypothetical protein|nr:hypothetical protein [Thermoanaerobaculia bacterium]
MRATEGRLVRATIAALGLLVASPCLPASKLVGDLPRAGGAALEAIPGLDTVYDSLTTADGVRLRTITTRPTGARGRLPAILFVQWLSCDTIELPASGGSGWNRMMRRVAQESGLVMMRTEKRGVGDSGGGPCSALDYRTELADHRAALARLRASPGVDPRRIVVFGASMGGTYAPLLAAGEELAGVIVWGAGARTWFERMLTFERNRRELTGTPAASLDGEMKSVSAFLYHYLVAGQSPRQIAAEHPALAVGWSQLVGTEGDLHYGRPLGFHQQAQQQDWARAWGMVGSPVLVLFGEYDWYESAASAQLIARIVERGHPGRARFALIPRTDHHFEAFASAEAAAAGTGGRENADPAVREILGWLRRTVPASTAAPARAATPSRR